MSSLAASRADGFYFPPDFDPSKGGLNAQQGTHALGKRAKKIDQGVIVVRFEAPYHIWCSGCNFKISKGCRFNAEKKAIGKYHSTKIWSFKMITPCCANNLEIHTDPKACEYVVVSGGVKKVEEYSAEDAGTQELKDQEEVEAGRSDPMARIEAGGEDRRRAQREAPTLANLHQDMTHRTTNHYHLNKALRRSLRAERFESAARAEEGRTLGLPEHIPLLPHSKGDEAAAASMFSAAQSSRDSSGFRAQQKLHRAAIRSSSIFSTPQERALPRGALLNKTSSSSKTSINPQSKGIKKQSKTAMSTQQRIELLAKRHKIQRSGVL